MVILAEYYRGDKLVYYVVEKNGKVFTIKAKDLK